MSGLLRRSSTSTLGYMYMTTKKTIDIERDRLKSDTDLFLESGGKIEYVDIRKTLYKKLTRQQCIDKIAGRIKKNAKA
jgi:hypothetical protein